MKHITVIVLGLSALILPSFGEGPAEQMDRATSTQRTNFAPGGAIHWKNSYGNLYIEGWDQPQVEITVIKSTKYDEPTELKRKDTRKLESVQVAIERRSDAELAISTALPRRANRVPPLPSSTKNGIRMEYQVHVPRNSRLVIDHHGGLVLVGNMTGDIEAANRDGDIMLMLPASGAYSIDARSKMGHIASDFAGSTRSRYIVGQRFVSTSSSPARRIHLHTGFGGITILAIPPEAEALSTASGE
jgi:hypothetical protein